MEISLPRVLQDLNVSPGHAKEGDGGGSNLGLNPGETSALGPLQQPGSGPGVPEGVLGGEGAPPPSHPREGDPGVVINVESQAQNDNSLAAVGPQTAEDEEEIIVSSPGHGTDHLTMEEDRSKKRKPSNDDMGDVKKVGRTEEVPLSSQSLDQISFQIVDASSSPLASSRGMECFVQLENIENLVSQVQSKTN